MTHRINIICLYDNSAFSAAIEYTFRLLLTGYSADYSIINLYQLENDECDFDNAVVVSYSREYINRNFAHQIHIYASDFFSKNYLQPSSMPKTPIMKYYGIPVIYLGSGPLDSLVYSFGKTIETNIDIIASSFFMVSRCEEIIIADRDEHDRFPATSSLAYREGFLDRPVVNEYMELLRSWLHALAPAQEPKPFWSGNKELAFCLTHDVDSTRMYSLEPPLPMIASAILKKRNLSLASSYAKAYLLALFGNRDDPYDTFDYILDLEREYGLKSSFYFMSDSPSSGTAYKLTEPKVAKLISQLEEAGCEIGLHAGYDSYDKAEIMELEKERLDKVVRNHSYGCRQHFLRWKTPETWRIQEQLGILYDTTLSYADHIGFRCGICLPFQPFDIIENRQLAIWELPLTVMDGSLQDPKYQNLLPENACNEIIRHIEIVSKFNGVFVLLWHNSSLNDRFGWKGWRKVYEKVIAYIGGKRVVKGNGREIIEKWRAYFQCS